MDFVDADCIINEALLLACPDEFWRKITWHTNSPCDFYIASNPYLRPNRGATGTTVEGATAEERQGATSLRGMVKVVTTIPCSLRTFATFITSPRSVQYCEDNVIFCEAFEEDDKVKWVHIAYGGNSPSDVVAMHRTTVCQIMVPLTENSPMRRFVDSVWNEECGKLTQGALTSIFVSGLKSAAHPRVPISHQYTRRKIHLSAFIAYELPISGVRVTFVFAPNESFPNMIDWCAKKIMCIRNLCQMFEWLNSGGHLIPKQIQGSDERYEGLGGSPRSLPGGTRPVPSLEYQKAEALIQVNTSTLSERVFDTLFALQASDAWRLAFQYEGCTVEECKARHCFPAPAFLKAYRFTTTITATMETFRSLVDDPLQLHRYDNFVENTMLIEEQNEEKVFYAQFRELLPSAPKRDICVFLSKKMLQPHEAQQLRLYQSTDSSSAVYVQNSVQSTKSPLRKGYERQLVYAMGFVVIPTTTHPLADARGGAQGEGALRVHYIVSVDTNTTTLSAEIEVAAVQQYFTRLVGIRQLCEGNKRVNPEYTPPCLASSTVSQRGSSKRVTFIEVETLEDHQLEEISNVMDVRRYIYTDDSLDISHEQFDQQNPETFEAPSLDKFYSLLRVMPIITKRDDDNIIKMPVITCVDDLPQTETEEYNYTQVTPQEQTEEVHRSHENNNNILTTGDSDKGILVQAGQQLKVSSTKGTQQCEDGTTLAWGDNDKGILVQAGQQLKVSSTKGTQQCEDGTTLAWGDNDKGILVQAGQQLKGSSTKGTQQCEDGTTIAWGDSDKGILVQAGQQLKVSSTKGTQQCEDGTTLAWGDNDKGILVQAGQQLKVSSTKGTQQCEDGTTLAWGDNDKGILVQAGQQVKGSSTKGTQQCEDGTTLAWGDSDKGILVQAGQQLKSSSTKGTQQCEDGTTLAWGDSDKGILVQAGQQLKSSSTKGTQQCEDGTTIAWGDSDKGILVQAGQQLKVSSTKGTQQCEDGTTLAWGDNDKGILVQAGQQVKGSSTKGTQPCEDGTTLAWGDNDKGILVQAGQQVKGSSTKGTQPCEDGTTLAWGDNDKGILVQAGQQLKSSSTKGTQPCEDGTTIAWGDNDKGILVQAGQQLKSSSTKGTQPCEDGTTIAWGDNDKGILVQAGQQVKGSSTKGTQPCEDGTTLAWGDNDKGILVQAGQQLKSSSTKGTQPCEDGTTIAWGDNDKGILVQAGQQVKSSSTKRTQPCEDGTTIAWGDNDKGILVQAGQQVKGSSTKGTQQCEDGTTIAWGDNDKGILVQAGQQLKVSFTENRKDKGSDPSGALLQIEGKIMADGQQGGAAKIKAIPWNSTTLPTNEGKSATEWPEIFSGGVQHDQRRVGELTLHPLHKEVRPQLTPFHGVHGSIELCVTQQEKTDAGKTQETVGEKFPLKADAPSSGVVKQPISLRGKAPRALRGMKRSEDQSLKKGLTSREAPREFVKGLKVWPTPDALKVRPRKGASVFAPQSDLHYTQEIRNKEWEEEVCAESLMQKGDEWFAIENVGAHGSVGDLGYSGRTISGMHRRETQQTVQLNVWRCRNMPATKTSPDSMLFIHVSTSFGQARTGLVPLVLNPIFPQHPILLDRPYDDTVSIVAIVKTSDGRMKRLGEAVISLRLLHVMQSYTRWVSLICNAGTSNAYECGDVCITLYREADKGCDNQLAGPTSNTGPQLLKWEEDERTEEEEELRRYIRDVLVTSGNENLHLLEWLVGFCFRRTPDEIDEFIRKYRKEDMVTLTIYEMSELRTEHGAPLLRSDPCYIVAETSRGLSRTPSMTVKEQGVSMNEAFHLVVGVNEVIRLIVFFGRMEIGETLIYAGREDCISTRLIVSRAGTAEAVPCGNITVGTRRSSVADIDNALEVPPLVTEEESEGMECLRHILWVNAPSSLHRLDVIASSQLEYNHYLEKFGPTLGWYDVRVTLKYWKPSSSVWDSPLVNEKAGRNSVGRREEALARHVRTTYRKIYAIINVGLEYHKTSLISVNRLGEAYLDEVIQVRGMIPGKDEVVVSIIGKSIEGMEDHDLGVVSLPLYSLKQLKPTHMTVPLVRDAGTIDACIKGSLYLELFAISCDGTPLNHFQAAICRPNMRSILYNHAPQQLHRVECFLGSYAGCEKEALVAMRERYGPDMLKTHMDIKVLTVNVREPVLNGYLKVHLNGSTVLRTGKLDNETFSNIGSSGVQNEVRVPINDIFDIRLVFKVKFTRYLMAKTHCKGEFNIRGAVVSQEGVYWIPLVNNQDMDAGEICVELRSSAFIVNSTVLKAPDDVETDVVSLLRRYRPSKIPLARSLIREATSRETAHAEILKEVVTNPVAVTLFLSVEHLSIHRSGLSLELGGDCEKQPEDETEYVVTANFGGDENSTISQNFTPQGNSCTIRLDVSPPQRGKAHQELTIAVQRRCATSSPMSHKKNHEAQPGKTFSLSLLRKRLFSGQKRSKNVQRPQQQTENVGCAVISLRALFTPLLYAPGEVVTVPLVHVPHRKEDENEVGWKVKENEKSSQKKWRPASTNQPSGCELVGYISFRVRLAAYEKPPSWMQFNPKTLERDNKVSRTVMRYYEECIHTILSEHMQQSLLDVHYRMYDRCVASGEWLQQLSGWKKSLLKQFPEARCSRDVSPTITPRPSTPPASRGSENTSESGTLKQSDHGISTDGCNIAESEVQSEKERKSELESESERKGEKESESGLGSESESRSRSELGGKKRSESESRSRSELGGKKGSESELRSRSRSELGGKKGLGSESELRSRSELRSAPVGEKESESESEVKNAVVSMPRDSTTSSTDYDKGEDHEVRTVSDRPFYASWAASLSS